MSRQKALIRLIFSLFIMLLFTNSLLLASSNSSAMNSAIEAELDAGFEDSFDDEIADEFSDEFANEQQKEFDPLSGYNRMMTNFNDGLYRHVVFPLGRGYRKITPKQFRESVGNFFLNLEYPVRLVNNLLQLKFQNSLEETERFVVNSTIGLAGLFDPASSWLGIKEHDEDFGQTLGHYGVGGGFYLVLPFFGPSNLRDTLSLVVDWQVDPFFYQEGRSYNLLPINFWQSIGLKSFQYFNQYSDNIEAYENLTKDAIDIYPLLKSVYEQNRQKEIEE